MNKDNNEDLNENKGKKFKMLFGIIFLVLLAIIFFFVIHQSAKRYNGTDSAYSDLFKKYEFKKMPNFIQPRDGSASAVELLNGNILFTGGMKSGDESTSSTEIFDISKKKFIGNKNMNVSRAGHSSILLPDGNVLITGGELYVKHKGRQKLKSAEIYDIKTGKFIHIHDMKEEMSHHKMFLLNDGNVLIIKNPYKIELFDSKKYSFKKIDGMSFLKDTDADFNKSYIFIKIDNNQVVMFPKTIYNSPIILLRLDNKTLLPMKTDTSQQLYLNAGYINENKFLIMGKDSDNKTSTVVVDLKNNVIKNVKPINKDRRTHQIIPLCDGNSIIVGGESGVAYTLKSLSSTELYISKENKFIKFKNMHKPRNWVNYIKLRDGNYMIYGGYYDYGNKTMKFPEILEIKKENK